MGNALPLMNRSTTKNLNYKMAIVVRNDISMGKGKVGAQCAHAALECYRKGSSKNKSNTRFWLLAGQPKIVLRVASEEGLIELATKAHKLGLTTAVIKDAGRTQLQPGTVTVLGIGPGPRETVDKVTDELKLL